LSYLPILLKLRDRPCLVVGGGATATKRVEELLSMQARVTVISPQVTAAIERLAATSQLWLFRRLYATGDLKGYFLAYAATGVAAVDRQIARDAESERVLLSVVEHASFGDFLNPPVVQRGDLAIAISTNGKSRGFAQLMKKKLEALIGPEYGDLLNRVEAERLITKSPHSTGKPERSLANEAAS
jgi:siroheme synthase-like protein